MNVGTDQFARWRGATETHHDLVTAVPARALAALLDQEKIYQTADVLPAPAHWLYFLQTVRQSQIGVDGHPQRGGFLPPISLPRRMWAGSRIEFHQPLRIGDEVSRTSRIDDVSSKQGRSGALVFVSVSHQIHTAQGLAISEQQDIVYRDVPVSGDVAAPKPALHTPAWTREIKPDSVLLLRYSALTFNAHRIHYDRPYATGVEHYPGLVVHGPLIATLLLDLLYEFVPDASVRQFSFRAVTPLFDTAPFFVCGAVDAQQAKTIQLWAKDQTGMLAMEAQAVLA
jgi:3-methylfumaryl-CoA hydratase